MTVEGFEEIYQRYFREIYRYLLALTGDRALAEELTAETFFRAFLGLDRFRGDCHVRIWLCRIAKNLWYSHLRKKRRPEEPLPEGPESITDRLEDMEQAWEICPAMTQLREPYQTVLALRVLNELPFQEIGAAYGKSAHWACVTYHRAKDQIRAAIGGTRHE